jgi:hypothetical protein
MNDLEELDLVALLRDLPEHSLTRGQIGTVVMVHSPHHFEVEFWNRYGQTIALLALPSSALMRIHRDAAGGKLK